MLVYDYRQQVVIDFFIEKCINMTKSKYIDGCFIDRANQELTDGSFVHYAFNDTHKQIFAAGHDKMLQQLQQELNDNNQSIMISNNYCPKGCIATMIEGFGGNTGNIEKLLNYSKQGILVEAHANNKNCSDNISFTNSLAAFLIGAGEYSYFGCSRDWYIEPDWIIDHPQYHKPLGKPMGDAVLENHIWKRSFESGTNVTFENGVGTIIWSDGQIDVGR